MQYREIVAVTGLGGLYQLLTTKSDGAIVRNVADKSTRFISARQHNVTPLESIEVYTTGENVRLQHVFQKMQEHEAAIPLADAKTTDTAVIRSYFKSIFPEFDDERVYVSDMKKMLKWYEVLKANDLLRFEEPAAEETEEEAQEEEAAQEEIAAAEAAMADVPATDTPSTPEANDSQTPNADTTSASPANAENPENTGDIQPKKAPKKKKAEDAATTEDEETPAKKPAAKKKATEEGTDN